VLRAASRNTAQFVTPGITPKFRMTRRPMRQRRHGLVCAPCAPLETSRPHDHAQGRAHRENVNYKGYVHHASKEDPQYEIKSDKTDHIALDKTAALKLIRR
jgi:hypothetical protein